MENIYDVKDDLGNGNFYRTCYIQVSKFDFARAVTKTFWTKLADVDRVTYLTEKELNREVNRRSMQCKHSKSRNLW